MHRPACGYRLEPHRVSREVTVTELGCAPADSILKIAPKYHQKNERENTASTFNDAFNIYAYPTSSSSSSHLTMQIWAKNSKACSNWSSKEGLMRFLPTCRISAALLSPFPAACFSPIWWSVWSMSQCPAGCLPAAYARILHLPAAVHWGHDCG